MKKKKVIPYYIKKRINKNKEVEVYDDSTRDWILLSLVLSSMPDGSERAFDNLPEVPYQEDDNFKNEAFQEGESGGGGADRSFDPDVTEEKHEDSPSSDESKSESTESSEIESSSEPSGSNESESFESSSESSSSGGDD